MIAGDIKIDFRYCNGCGRCYDLCPMDVYGWNDVEVLPTVAYPAECWHCGTCELACPEEAITILTPFFQKFFWGIYPEIEVKK